MAKKEGDTATKGNAWLEFAGKLITPLTIIILVFSFKSTVEERLGQTTEVSVLGSSFKFENEGANIELSALEFYFVIHAHVMSETMFKKSDTKDSHLAAIYLLKSKEILELEETKVENTEGTFISTMLTEKGKKLIEQLGLA